MDMFKNLLSSPTIKFFKVDTIANTSMYISTEKYKDEKELISNISSNFTSLRQLHTETEVMPITFCKGYFLAAQQLDKKSISERYHKLWEIL
jgi:hypothetical protein